MYKPEGVYAAMMTPVDESQEPWEQSLRACTNLCIQGGIQGLFPVSSVGEFVHFSLQQKKRIIDIVCDEAAGRLPVIPGTADTNPARCAELAEHARARGCQAIVVCPPYFYPLDHDRVERHYRQLAAAVPDIPIILYNIPMFTSPISHEVVARLSHVPNIIGLKDSSGSMIDLMNYLDRVRLERTSFTVLTGREETFVPALMGGAEGCMVVISGIVPEFMSTLYRLWQRQRIDEAKELQYELLGLVRAMAALPFPVGFKLALESRGIPMGPFLQPVPQDDPKQREADRARIGEHVQRLLSVSQNKEVN